MIHMLYDDIYIYAYTMTCMYCISYFISNLFHSFLVKVILGAMAVGSPLLHWML